VAASPLKKISDARIAWAGRRLGWFESALLAIARNWRAELVDLAMAEKTPGAARRVKRIARLQTAIQGQLTRLGYEDLSAEFVDSFDGARRFALDTLKAMRLKSKPLSQVDENALRNIRQMNLSEFAAIGTRATQTLASGIMMDALAGASRAEMIRHLSETIEGRFAAYASTYADTALVGYDRRVSWATWTEAGITQYMYRGPKDIKTRPFCDERVGKTYSMDEIKAMDNGKGQPKPVWEYGGGWNCRHVWTPVP